MATMTQQVTYQCDECGKTAKKPADQPVPQCCGKPMTRGSAAKVEK